MKSEKNNQIDIGRRKFLNRATALAGGIAIGSVAVPFLSSWQPSAKTKSAGLTVESDISNLKAGEMIRVVWKKKPVFIFRRQIQEIKGIEKLDVNLLADPNSKNSIQPQTCLNAYRSIKKEYGVVVGVCTHLSCAPNYFPGSSENEIGGFLCPCHGSKFDLAGRVYKNMPATRNLNIPPYKFISETHIKVG